MSSRTHLKVLSRVSSGKCAFKEEEHMFYQTINYLMKKKKRWVKLEVTPGLVVFPVQSQRYMLCTHSRMYYRTRGRTSSPGSAHRTQEVMPELLHL